MRHRCFLVFIEDPCLIIDSSIFPITIPTHMTIHNGGHCPQEEKGPELANVMIGFVKVNPKDS